MELRKEDGHTEHAVLLLNIISSGFISKIILPTKNCEATSTLIDNVIYIQMLLTNRTYSGGKKNPDLPIKSTENLKTTCRHCKRLVITSTDVVLCLYSL